MPECPVCTDNPCRDHQQLSTLIVAQARQKRPAALAPRRPAVPVRLAAALHLSTAGRTYAVYSGMYIAVALIWLRVVDGVTLTRWDVTGAVIALVEMGVIALQQTGG
jgi:drug/metabolite transporter superfamily protein YnfA